MSTNRIGIQKSYSHPVCDTYCCGRSQRRAIGYVHAGRAGSRDRASSRKRTKIGWELDPHRSEVIYYIHRCTCMYVCIRLEQNIEGMVPRGNKGSAVPTRYQMVPGTKDSSVPRESKETYTFHSLSSCILQNYAHTAQECVSSSGLAMRYLVAIQVLLSVWYSSTDRDFNINGGV